MTPQFSKCPPLWSRFSRLSRRSQLKSEPRLHGRDFNLDCTVEILISTARSRFQFRPTSRGLNLDSLTKHQNLTSIPTLRNQSQPLKFLNQARRNLHLSRYTPGSLNEVNPSQEFRYQARRNSPSPQLKNSKYYRLCLKPMQRSGNFEGGFVGI